MNPRPPLVLCCSGHDPSGGAGLQADLEALAAQGVHGLSLITALTAQDTHDVQAVYPVAAARLARIGTRLLADCRPQAVKIGLLGHARQVPVLSRLIRACGVPVVLDPVLRAGGGRDLAGTALQTALLESLLPLTTVLTPNLQEARRLVPEAADADAAAAALLARGCDHVLVTGGDEPGARVRNVWYHAGGRQVFDWPRLDARFHGAGCTLAAGIAARLALGDAVGDALLRAQQATQAMLARAVAVGRGRLIPGRRPA
jgi:hydroxymethylpyrimidine/phosphomethylpyrimidine kinase